MTILDTIRQYRDQLDALLADQPERTGAIRPLAERPLRDQLQVFEQIAQGKLDRERSDPSFVGDVADAVDRLLALLCVPPDLADRTLDVVPRNLWTRSPLGILLAEVAWWVYHDDLITLGDAAQHLYHGTTIIDLHRIRAHLAKGELRPYIDPHEANPQYAGRVRRSEVERLKEQRERAAAAPAPPEPQALQAAPDIIAMHDEEGLSFGEIGRRLGKHRQQIHQMYHRLKKKQHDPS